jgi:hypothetical protein
MSARVVTRRGSISVIGGAAAAAALAYTLGSDKEPGAAPGKLAGPAQFRTVGKVIAASASRLTVSAGGRTIQVLRGEGMRAYAGVAGRVSSFTAFLAGDRVFVEGTPTGPGQSTVRALAVSSVLQPTQVRITGLDGSGYASTTAGSVDLRGYLPDINSANDSVRVGEFVSGYSWVNPASGQKYLLVPQPQY